MKKKYEIVKESEHILKVKFAFWTLATASLLAKALKEIEQDKKILSVCPVGYNYYIVIVE